MKYANRRTVVEVIDGFELFLSGSLDDVFEKGADGLFGVIADVEHVRLDRLEIVFLDHYKNDTKKSIHETRSTTGRTHKRG